MRDGRAGRGSVPAGVGESSEEARSVADELPLGRAEGGGAGGEERGGVGVGGGRLERAGRGGAGREVGEEAGGGPEERIRSETSAVAAADGGEGRRGEVLLWVEQPS